MHECGSGFYVLTLLKLFSFFFYVIDCDGDVLRGYHSLLSNRGQSNS